MNSKFKKIVSNLLLVSFTGSSIIACSNDSNTSSGPSTPSLTASSKSASSNDSFDGLWANVVNYDSTNLSSNLSLVPNNDSNADVTFLGCDNDKVYALNPESMNFPAGYQFPTTTDYADKWVTSFPLQPDGKKSPIYSSAAIFDHAIHFHDVGQSGSAKCYFKLNNPHLGAPLYFKLSQSWHSECSDYGTGCTKIRDYVPQLLAEHREKTSWWYIGGSTADVGGLGLGMLAGYLRYRNVQRKAHADVSMAEYIDDQISSIITDYYGQVAQFMKPFENMSPEEFEGKSVEEWYAGLSVEQKSGYDGLCKLVHDSGGNGPANLLAISKTDVGDIDAQIRFGMKNYLEDYKSPGSRIWTNDFNGYRNQTWVNRRTNLEEEVTRTREIEARGYQGAGITRANTTIEKYSVQNGVAVEDITLKDLFIGGKGLPSEYVSHITGFEAQAAKTGVANPFVNKLRKVANKDKNLATTEGVGSGTFVFILVMEAFHFLLGRASQILGGSPAIGAFDTTKNLTMLAAVSQADADSWNKLHPDKPIDAKTVFMSASQADAVSQVVMLSSSDSKVDGQYAVTISAQALSTPFERYEHFTPDIDMEDPFFGKITKHGDDTHKGDAAIVLNLTDNSGVATQDIDFAMAQTVGDTYNVKQLSDMVPLPPPTYKITSITDAQKQTLPLSAVWRKAGELLSSRSKVLKDKGNIDGLVFNHDQTVTMRVTLPAASSAKNDSGTITSGSGLWVNLAGQEDDIPINATGAESLPSKPAFFSALSSYAEATYGGSGSGNSVFSHKFNCQLPFKPGSSCDLVMKLTGRNDGRKHLATLVLADKGSYSTYIPVYINYNLISKTNQIEIDAGDAYPHGVSFKNVSGKTYQQLGMNGLPKGATVSYQPSGCNTNLASGSECLINFNLKNVNVDGDTEDFLMNIYGIDGGNVGKPFESIPDMDRLPLKITINNSDWAAANGKKAASAGR